MSVKSQEDRFKAQMKQMQTLKEEAIKINTKIEQAQASYEKMRSVVKEKYGSDDIDELSDILKKREEENEKKIQALAQECERLEAEIEIKSKILAQE